MSFDFYSVPQQLVFLLQKYNLQVRKPGTAEFFEAFIELLEKAAAALDDATFELALYYGLSLGTNVNIPFTVRFMPHDAAVLDLGVIDLQKPGKLPNILAQIVRTGSEQRLVLVYITFTDIDPDMISMCVSAARRGRRDEVAKLTDTVLYRIVYDGRVSISPVVGPRRTLIVERYLMDIIVRNIARRAELIYEKYSIVKHGLEKIEEETETTTGEEERAVGEEEAEVHEESTLESEQIVESEDAGEERSDDLADELKRALS